MSVKLLTEHHLEFISLTGDFTGLSESIHVKMPHCWKSRVAAHKSLSGALTRFYVRPVPFPIITQKCHEYNVSIPGK